MGQPLGGGSVRKFCFLPVLSSDAFLTNYNRHATSLLQHSTFMLLYLHTYIYLGKYVLLLTRCFHICDISYDQS